MQPDLAHFKSDFKYKMDIDIVNVRIPKEISLWLDSLVQRGIYSNKSEAVREFCREYVEEKKVRSNQK